jgi:sugar phosphate isomerase/epimerase
MSTTRTGNFPIGFRRGWSDWQKKSIKDLAQWTKASGFAVLDLMNITPADLTTLKDAGIRIGSVDLLDFGKLMANDVGQRKELIQKNIDFVKQLAPAGAKVFFTCIIPGDPAKKRDENYKLAVESFTPIAQACAELGASLAIEGWPGGGPHLANLCCNPETTRAFIKDVGKGVGLNYDPSHLIRLGIEHIRFVREFAPHFKHVHAKDTELDSEAMYEYGAQGSAFAKPHGFGEWNWRYTAPGHGVTRWSEAFRILKSAGYGGAVSIELEDENFNGSEEGEKSALLHSLNYLRGV